MADVESLLGEIATLHGILAERDARLAEGRDATEDGEART
jgi:hypothetical protein